MREFFQWELDHGVRGNFMNRLVVKGIWGGGREQTGECGAQVPHTVGGGRTG